MSNGRAARILVADDDPVSLQFLVAALREFGHEAIGAAGGNAALALCAGSRFDLLLLDRRMPDLGGAALLRELRHRDCATAAIATSAELDAPIRAELAAAGYADAVTKPIGTERLAAVLAAHLPRWHLSPDDGITAASLAAPPATSAAAAVLEDGPALAGVGGDRQTLQALRGLFSKELETMLPRIAAMPADELGEWLHRLRASCRYCGATRLLEAAERRELELKQSGSGNDVELAALLEAVAATMSALHKSG